MEHVHHAGSQFFLETGMNAYRCVGVCAQPTWPMWGELELRPEERVNHGRNESLWLAKIDPNDDAFRTMLDAYGDELLPYEPPAWADSFKHAEGEHTHWPSLLGAEREWGLEPSIVCRGRTGKQPRGPEAADVEVLGFVVLREWDSWGEVRDLYVLPDWRRRGIGRVVVEGLQRRWPQGILCDVLRKNEPAVWFWTKLGFERIGDSPRWGKDALGLLGVHAWPRGRFNLGRP